MNLLKSVVPFILDKIGMCRHILDTKRDKIGIHVSKSCL